MTSPAVDPTGGRTGSGSHAQSGAPSNLDAPPSPRARLVTSTVLARGGMGEILLARQTSLDREVAVKVVTSEPGSPSAGDPTFAAETLVTAWLEHPGVVAVHDAGEDFLVMQRIRGQTLSALIAAHGTGPAALRDHVQVLVKVCETVSFAHSRGIIHRDLKPANIMVGDFGEVVVIDWGLAVQAAPATDGRVRAPAPADADVCSGTPAYMPPEVADADHTRLGFATDLFLLGATLWHLLTGRPPYQAETIRRTIEAAWRMRRGDIGRIAPHAPAALVALAEQAMARNPGERGDLAGFADGLRAWLARSALDLAAGQARDHASQLLSSISGIGEVPRPAPSSTDPANVVGVLTAAVAACDRCLSLAPGDEEAAELRRQALHRHARLAFAEGDHRTALRLAELCQDASTAAAARHAASAIAAAVRLARLRRGLAIALAAAALVAAGWAWAGHGRPEYDGVRLEQAERTAVALGTWAGWETAAATADRAAPNDLALHRPILDGYLEWAIRQKQRDLAVSLLARRRQAGPVDPRVVTAVQAL